MVHWLELIYFLILLEALLRCLYFWQLKEYRWDRFREFLKTSEAKRYFLPGRNFLRPRLTLKIVLLFLFGLVLSRQFVWWLGYLLVPVTTAFLAAAFSPISDLVKWIVVLLAKLKLLFWHRRLLVIGITGSYGKTSTKEILAHVLAAKFMVAKTPETNNTLIGVAKAVLKLKPATEIFVVEMGAYKIGEIAAICRLVKPKIGILTGINQQHLGLFGSQEKIIQAKSELLRALPKNGLAVVNGESQLARRAARGINAGVKYYQAGSYPTNLLGAHQQLNIAAAMIVAKYLGVDKFNLTDIPRFKTALTRVTGLNGAVIINDSYNSNPDGFLAAIALAKTIPARKKVLISPGIIELGRASKEVHARLRLAAAAVFDQVHITKNETQLLKKLKTMLTKNHLLLIEGRFSAKFIRTVCLKQS